MILEKHQFVRDLSKGLSPMLLVQYFEMVKSSSEHGDIEVVNLDELEENIMRA